MNIQKVSPSFCAQMLYKGNCQWTIGGRRERSEDEALFSSTFVESIQPFHTTGLNLTFANGNTLYLSRTSMDEYNRACKAADAGFCRGFLRNALPVKGPNHAV